MKQTDELLMEIEEEKKKCSRLLSFLIVENLFLLLFRENDIYVNSIGGRKMRNDVARELEEEIERALYSLTRKIAGKIRYQMVELKKKLPVNNHLSINKLMKEREVDKV